MERLIQRLKEGSPEAWEEFVSRFKRLVYSVFCQKSFGFSQEEMDELFHDFMVGMMENRFHKVRRFEGRNGCSFPSYLKKIAINMAIDRKKRLLRRRMVSLQASLSTGGSEREGELQDVLDGGHAPPPSVLEDREETARFLDLLYRLPTEKLLVLVLILYHRFEREALGKLLHTSRQNIDVIFNRTKNKLQQLEREAERRGGAAAAGGAVEWGARVRALRRALVLSDREAVLARCLERLSVPEELLTGLLFLNAPVLDPTPARTAGLLGRAPTEVERFVERVLERIAVEEGAPVSGRPGRKGRSSTVPDEKKGKNGR